MSPFTKDVLASLESLQRGIASVATTNPDDAKTLTALFDDLVTNLESQMILVFANFGLKTKAENDAMLRSRADQSILEQYREACGTSAELKVDAADGKMEVPNRREPVPTVRPLPADVAQMQADVSVQRTLLSAIHVSLEALGHAVGAERTCLYVAQKGTGTLRVIGCAPDVTPAKRGAFLPAHQGIVGSCFSTGIALRADAPTAEIRRSYIEPLDSQLGFRTENFLAFPVIDPASRQPVAVVECANKPGRFSDDDEALMAHTCRLMWFMVCYHELDFHNGMIFNPAALHSVRPFRPSSCDELRSYHSAAGAHRHQLIVRLASRTADSATETLAKHLGLALPTGEVPAAVKGTGTVPDGAVPSGESLSAVRELNSYLSKVEDAHKHLMSELVKTQAREASLREECGKKSTKLRILEENTQALHEQLAEARQSLNQRSFSPLRDGTAVDFEGSSRFSVGLGANDDLMSNASFTALARSSSALPPIQGGSGGQPPAILGPRATASDPKAVMSQAAAMIAELRKVAGTSPVPLRHASTPPPQRSAVGDRSRKSALPPARRR